MRRPRASRPVDESRKDLHGGSAYAAAGHRPERQRILSRDPARSVPCSNRRPEMPAPQWRAGGSKPPTQDAVAVAELVGRWGRSEDRRWSLAFHALRDAGCPVIRLGSGMQLHRFTPVLYVGTRMSRRTTGFGAGASG